MQRFAPVPPDERRAAEERLRARYEARLMQEVEIKEGDRMLWPVGPGRVQAIETTTGAHIEAVLLEETFPQTCVVIVFRHPLRPGDRLACCAGLWPRGQLDLVEPPYNDVLGVNFGEWIAANIRRTPALADDGSLIPPDA